MKYLGFVLPFFVAWLVLSVLFLTPEIASAKVGWGEQCRQLSSIYKTIDYFANKLGVQIARADPCEWTTSSTCSTPATAQVIFRWPEYLPGGSYYLYVSTSGGYNAYPVIGTTFSLSLNPNSRYDWYMETYPDRATIPAGTNLTFSTPNCAVGACTISPVSASLDLLTTIQLRTQWDPDASGPLAARDVTNQTAWSSNSSYVASVSSAGVVTGQSSGSAIISANYSGLSCGTSLVTVNSPACVVPAQQFDWSDATSFVWPVGSYNRSYTFTISRNPSFNPPLTGAPIRSIPENRNQQVWNGSGGQQELYPNIDYYWKAAANYTVDVPTAYPVNCYSYEFPNFGCSSAVTSWNCSIGFSENSPPAVGCLDAPPDAQCFLEIGEWYGVRCNDLRRNVPTAQSRDVRSDIFRYACVRPTLSVDLTAATDGISFFQSLSGANRLENVDLRADVDGTSSGPITYYFDCNNDGTFEIGPINNGPDPIQRDNICNYEVGRHFAKVRVERSSAIPAEDTVQIDVAEGNGSIRARIFRDDNRNGLADSGEPYIRNSAGADCDEDITLDGLVISYSGARSGLVSVNDCSTTVPSVPRYVIPDLPTGNYALSLTAPFGWVITQGGPSTGIQVNPNTVSIWAFGIAPDSLSEPSLNVVRKDNDQPCSPCTINENESLPLKAIYDSDGPGGPNQPADVTDDNLTSWFSDDISIITISNVGPGQKGVALGGVVVLPNNRTLAHASFGGKTADANIVVRPFDYSLRVAQPVINIQQGVFGANDVFIDLVSPFSRSVSLTAIESPVAGFIYSFGPNSTCDPNCSRVIRVTVPSAATPRPYTITVTGTSGSRTRTVQFTVNVTIPALSASCSVTPTEVVRSGAVNFSVGSIIGGISPYICTWSDGEGGFLSSAGAVCPSRAKIYSIAVFSPPKQVQPNLVVVDRDSNSFGPIACDLITIRNPQCSDSVDNDGDGAVDYRTPPSLQPRGNNDRGCDNDDDDSEGNLPLPRIREVIPR